MHHFPMRCYSSTLKDIVKISVLKFLNFDIERCFQGFQEQLDFQIDFRFEVLYFHPFDVEISLSYAIIEFHYAS